MGLAGLRLPYGRSAVDLAPCPSGPRSGRRASLWVVASTGRAPERRGRLLETVLSTPQRVERYFEGSPLRKGMWAVIAYSGGYYAGNVVTLSFGALAVNDVLAAALTVAFYEVVTNLFYEAPQKTLRLWFANLFKVGVVTGMLADALKLGG